jgi:hypothetical protein
MAKILADITIDLQHFFEDYSRSSRRNSYCLIFISKGQLGTRCTPQITLILKYRGLT